MTLGRDWLRGFLRLDARQAQEGIPSSDIARQEDTVLRALDVLDQRPGVVLADEVGLGKTYEALGVSAAVREQRGPDTRIVVVTPGPDLNMKWYGEFARFRTMYSGFRADVEAVRSLPEFVEAVRNRPIVVAPVTMFAGGRGGDDQVYLLSLFCHWKGLHGRTTNAILARFRDGQHERVDVRREKFLGRFSLADLEPHLTAAFRRASEDDEIGLDDIYEADRLTGFDHVPTLRAAIYRARFALVGELVPHIDLLVIDEAHKLKNGESLRSRGMRTVFRKRFDKALFLTATPFQLDVSELREIFGLFDLAKTAPNDLRLKIDALLQSVREYQTASDRFQEMWAALDEEAVAGFHTLFQHDSAFIGEPMDPTLRLLVGQARELRRHKQELEPQFRAWMIRSLRPGKRTYRKSLPQRIDAQDSAVLPFLAYERFIAELFRSGRQTHKAAVEINMASSYAAAREGALLNEDGAPLTPEAERYRGLLRDMLATLESGADEHPKLRRTIAESIEAAERGEKTLVFCARVATLEELRRRIDAIWLGRLVGRWRRAYPDALASDIWDEQDEETDRERRGRHSALQTRFHRRTDALHLVLRERHLHTLVPIADWALGHLEPIVARANEKLRGLGLGETSAHRRDYAIAKRCVEQAAVELAEEGNVLPVVAADALEAMQDPAFLTLGLDLTKDDYETDDVGHHAPTWAIDEELARIVIGELPGVWDYLHELLPTDRELRVRVVEQLARYLTKKQVPFLADLLAAAREAGVSVEPIESHTLRRFADTFWDTRAGEVWWMRLRAFLEYFEQRDSTHRREILDGPIKTGQFARHTKDGESRERLREAFNTPLFPMILLANEVMQEGLDLHRNCRRIIHHDLAWNPAQIEQRIGRIDRLGSLTDRLRDRKADVMLEVVYPQVRRTIDERMYRTVRTREKWLEFLLGSPPDYSGYTITDQPVAPLPDGFAEALRIDLAPRSGAK